MKDNELRAVVLQKYYELRRRGMFQWCEVELEDNFPIKEFGELARICDQLAEHGLIEWKPTRGPFNRAIGGFGKISAFGVDVVEGTAQSPITIKFDHSHTVHVSNSMGVQIGNNNTLSSQMTIEEINAAIDHSGFSVAEKEEAKSALSKFLEHPVIAAIIGGLASTVRPT
jgi:hypothetical protein